MTLRITDFALETLIEGIAFGEPKQGGALFGLRITSNQGNKEYEHKYYSES